MSFMQDYEPQPLTRLAIGGCAGMGDGQVEAEGGNSPVAALRLRNAPRPLLAQLAC